MLHDTGIQQPLALHPHPLYPIRSHEGLLAVLCVTTESKDLSQRLIALICIKWRIQPTLGHTTDWLGLGGYCPTPRHCKSCPSPSLSCFRAGLGGWGCFGVLGLVWGAGVGARGRAGWTCHGLALMWLGQRAPACAGSSPAAQPPPADCIKLLPNLVSVTAPAGTATLGPQLGSGNGLFVPL